MSSKAELKRAIQIIDAERKLEDTKSKVIEAEWELKKLTKYFEASLCGSPEDAEKVMAEEIKWAKTFMEGYYARP